MVASVRHAFSRWSNWPEAATGDREHEEADDDVKRAAGFATRFRSRALFGWMVT